MKVRHRSSSVVRIPPVDECLRLMDHHGMMPNIRRHSLLVARLAAIIGMALNRRGDNLEVPLIVAGALLHDIAKTRSLREGGNHVEMGRKMVLEMGYPEVAWIVGSHVDSGPEIANAIDEAAVVNYADKRVQHDRVVSLKDRFEDLMARYGRNPEKCSRLREMRRNMERLEQQIFSRISFSPDGLEVMIKNAPPISLPKDPICLKKMKTSEAITLLNQCHSFPGPYVFKVIGENTSHFYDAVLSAVSKELGEVMHQGESLFTRKSSGGTYLSITLKLEMESAEQVLRLYERFSKLDGLRSMM